MERTGDITRAIFREMEAGNREAFDRFFERQAARVLVYIHYNLGERLRRKLEPADVLQNLYLKLFKDFRSFGEKARERGIQRTLIRMADHEITEAYRFHFKVDRRDARREVAAAYLDEGEGKAHSPLDLVSSQATSVSQRVMRQEEYGRAMEMLRGLSPLEQYVTVSRVIEGLSCQEIADLLGKSRGAIQMVFARARDRLRSQAAREDRGAEGGRI